MSRENLRAETGPMAFANDWTGIFIRGDHAFMYKMAIESVLKDVGKENSGWDMIQWTILKGLGELMASCNVQIKDRPEPQKAQLVSDQQTT